MNDVFLLEAVSSSPTDVTLGETTAQAPVGGGGPAFFLPRFRRPVPPAPARRPVTYSLSFGVFAFTRAAVSADTLRAPVDWDAELEDLFVLGLWEVPV